MLETRITKLFGIKYPIICGGMFWVGRAELIAGNRQRRWAGLSDGRHLSDA